MIPCICMTIQGTWKQYTSYIIMPYLKGLQLQVEFVQIVFCLHYDVRVELDVHLLHSLRHLVQNIREGQWSLSHPFQILVSHLFFLFVLLLSFIIWWFRLSVRWFISTSTSSTAFPSASCTRVLSQHHKGVTFPLLEDWRFLSILNIFFETFKCGKNYFFH